MAFDACLLSALIKEINMIAAGGRIEKIYQPERDEIILQMRTYEGGKRLLINAGSSCPRMGFTEVAKENPMQAPMFCMLLRKHLTGALLSSVEQIGFDRVAKLTFDTRDEMGFECQKYIIAELMEDYDKLVEKAKSYGLDIRLYPESTTLVLYFHDDYPDTLLVDKCLSSEKKGE